MIDYIATLQPLLVELQQQIRTYEQSRRIYLPPSVRSQRIRERQGWIDAIRALLDEHEHGKGDTCTGANS